MTESSHDIPKMPPKAQMVTEALESMAVDGKSKVFGIDSVTLREFGVLALRGEEYCVEAIRWLRGELGEPEDEESVSDATLYRFIDALRAAYFRQRKTIAARIARLSVSHATKGNIADMTRVGWNAAVELVTEHLVTSDDVEQVLKNLPKLVATLSEAQHALDRQDRLDLTRQDLDRRLRETDERVRKLQMDNEALERKHRQSIEAAKAEASKLAAGDGESSSSGKLSEQDVLAILDRAMKGEL